MKRFKSERGEIGIEGCFVIIFVILFLSIPFYGVFKTIYSRTAGNKTAIDLKYNYDKAIVSLNDEKMEIDVDSWSDYDGEQIQIISKDGTVYLVSSFNTILIGK